MPFSPDDLGALFQGDGFTLWHYRTADTRAAVAAAGYFAPVAANMFPGDLIILQAADAMALLPVRAGTALGTGRHAGRCCGRAEPRARRGAPRSLSAYSMA